MRSEQITTFDDQVVELIEKYQQENGNQPMPFKTLLTQFEGLLLEDQKFKSADYLTPIITNLKGFQRIKSNDDADEATYEVVKKEA